MDPETAKYERYALIRFGFKWMVSFLLFFFLPVFLCAQDVKVTITGKATLLDAFKQIEKQTGYSVAYNQSKLDVNKTLSAEIRNCSLEKALSLLLKEWNHNYKIKGKHIIILPVKNKRPGPGAVYQVISGTVTDAASGENLIGALVLVPETKMGTVTNEYGFYSLRLPTGKQELMFSYMGYALKDTVVSLRSNERIDILLTPEAGQLKEVIVSAEQKSGNVSAPEMSVEKLPARVIKNIPALLGEVDVVKAIQLLPGVQPIAEGFSGFSVRGGGHSQNLILLDEAPVYNVSHLLGFFSIFNNDAIQNVKFFKGDFPAEMGGRLASVMDVRTKNGNNKRLAGEGGIGLISSRLTLDGPLGTDKVTFVLSGRRTYADLLLMAAKERSVRSIDLHFYDLNGKINYRINENNRIYLSGYVGKDVLGMNEAMTPSAWIDFGNKIFTFRWNRILSPQLFSNLTLVGSSYNYHMGQNVTNMEQEFGTRLQDYSLKMDFSYFKDAGNRFKFGYHFTYHHFIPGEGGGRGEHSIIEKKIKFPQQYAAEQNLYAAGETGLFEKLILKYGLRYTWFGNIGDGKKVTYLENYNPVREKTVKKGSVYHVQHRLEPRLGLLYLLNDSHSFKAAYTRTSQFIQLASNSIGGSPLDIWFLSTQNIKPQISDLTTAGYFRNLNENEYEISSELYYKSMKDLVDFKDHAKLTANRELEREFRVGKGYAYGLELAFRKKEGRLTGWIGYTLSKSRRKVKDVNDGKWYRSPYDKPHNISIVANYELSPRWNISGNWVYASGTPVTYPTGRYLMGDTYVPIYSGRNEYRFPNYHRLDLSVTRKLSKPGNWFRSELNFSLYNAYGRKNPWAIFFGQDNDRPDVSYAEMMYLFTVVPSVTWNFSF